LDEIDLVSRDRWSHNDQVATPGFELVRHRVPAALAGLVAGVVGMSERAPGPVTRRQPAGILLPLVLSWGPPLDVLSRSEGPGAGRYRSFVAGFTRGHTTTRHGGGQECVQVYLTPVGVQRLLGVPGSEIADTLEHAHDVAPGLGPSLVDRLGSAGSWTRRFAVVDEALVRLAGSGRPVDPRVAFMWSWIRRSGGQVRISELVARTGWSHRHATTTFRRQIGVTPKAAASVVRFEHAAAALPSGSLAEIAARYGYVDQSHFHRDVLRYSGDTPGELRRNARPTPYTALGRAPGDLVRAGTPGTDPLAATPSRP
jgi:AraC-like DNA-binding protein